MTATDRRNAPETIVTTYDGSGWWYLCIECGRSGATRTRRVSADREAYAHRCAVGDLAPSA